MDRKEFLSSIGLSSASIFFLACAGCSKKGDNGGTVTGPSGVDFTIDLAAPSNAALLNKGGYIYINGIIVAHSTAGAYIAVQQSCTHQNYNLAYDGSNQVFICNNHGSAFSEKGAVLNPPAGGNLVVYKTILSGSTLKITS